MQKRGPKDQTSKGNKCGVIYHIKCNECDHSYIGETARSFGTRFREHVKIDRTGNALTAEGEHCKTTGHTISMDNCKILGSEQNYWKRKVKESMEIREQANPLNRDKGYDLPPIYKTFWSPDIQSVDQ